MKPVDRKGLSRYHSDGRRNPGGVETAACTTRGFLRARKYDYVVDGLRAFVVHYRRTESG